MSRRANCWDNAVAESIFSSMKKERIRKRIYKTRDLARAGILEYIEVFYNRARRDSHWRCQSLGIRNRCGVRLGKACQIRGDPGEADLSTGRGSAQSTSLLASSQSAARC